MNVKMNKFKLSPLNCAVLLVPEMSYKLKLEDVAYFSHEHSKHTVRQLLTGQGRWTSPSNAKIEMMEAEVSLL